MKALPFTIPKIGNASFIIQEDQLESFYPYLHKHEELQICWIKKGRGSLIVEAEIHHFEKDDVFIIASNRAHLFKNETDESVKTLSLFFSANPENNPLMRVSEMEEYQKFYCSISSCNRLDKRIRLLLDKIQNAKKGIAFSHFIFLLDQLLHTLPLETKTTIIRSDSSEQKMRQIMEYTIENYKNRINISAIAAHTNYSPEAFCRFFRKHTGKTYINYLNELRINASAQNIIQQEISNIQRVAYESGFNNVSHFNRVFKKYKGCSPLQYKKQYFSNKHVEEYKKL